MNKKKIEDLNIGLKMEEILHPLFENKFGKLNKTRHYHSFDYENDNVLIELKTRNVKWKQYPSLMFSKKKIDYLVNNKIKKDAYFFFKLTDGIFYWKYNEDEMLLAIGGRNDRGQNEYSECVFIKNEFIKNYNDLEFQKYEYDENSKHKDED
tara:strand:+ start:78 stop:533 length:456 start_codon:yes stop_codon:yes gene_type:complete